MSRSSYAPFYDLFKLVVAIILLLIFLFLSRIAPKGSPESVTSISTPTPLPPTPTIASPTQTSISPTVASPTQTSIPPTNTPLPTSTPTPEPTNTPEPIKSPDPETSPTPVVESPSEPGEVCAKLAPPQLQVGMKAIIQRRLNFRSSPGIKNNWILTNTPGTQVEVVGGPTCTRYEDGIAYLWWQIELPNGQVGWSAEASAHGYLYFMEPVR